MRMFELVPVPVITDFLLVLFTKSLPFYAITFASTQILTGVDSISFFKKKRTQNSAVYRQIRINPSHS